MTLEIRDELGGDNARDPYREEMRWKIVEPMVRRHQLMDVPVDQYAVTDCREGADHHCRAFEQHASWRDLLDRIINELGLTETQVKQVRDLEAQRRERVRHEMRQREARQQLEQR